jgi:SSS family solute:Na+ symporter/sodium/proline symporter
MSTVIIIEVLNRVYESSSLDLWILKFPYDSQMIAIPALIASVLSLVFVSLITKPTHKDVVAPFFEEPLD